MAPAGRAVVVLALSLLYLSGAIISTEYFSTLAFFNGELNERGCGPSSEWEEYSPDCGEFYKHGVATSSQLAVREECASLLFPPVFTQATPTALPRVVIYLFAYSFIHFCIYLLIHVTTS